MLNQGIQDVTEAMDKHDQMLSYHNIYKQMGCQLPHTDPLYPRVKENTGQNKILLLSIRNLIESSCQNKNQIWVGRGIIMEGLRGN